MFKEARILSRDEVEDHERSIGADITCLHCGRSFSALGVHLRYEHAVSAPAYKESWGLPQGLRLLSVKTYENQSKAAFRRMALGRCAGFVIDPKFNRSEVKKKLAADGIRRKYGRRSRLVRMKNQTARLKGVNRKLKRKREETRGTIEKDRWITELLSLAEMSTVFKVSTRMLMLLGYSHHGPGMLPIRQRWQGHAVLSLLSRGISAREAGLLLGGLPHSGKNWAAQQRARNKR